MEGGGEGIAQRGVHLAVLGQFGHAFEAGPFHMGGEVGTVGVIHADRGARQGGLDFGGEGFGQVGHGAVLHPSRRRYNSPAPRKEKCWRRPTIR